MKNIHPFTRSLSLLFCAVAFLLSSLTGSAQTTNQVLSLDGSGDYVSIPSASDLQNTNEITVEAWIYPTNIAGSEYFIIKGDGGFVYSDRSYELGWQSGTIMFSVFLGVNTWGAIGASVPANQWVHIAGTYSSADSLLKIYTNGVLANQTTNDASGTILLNHQLLRQSTLPVVFGGELTHPMRFAAGRMDEVRIWTKARTAAEIAGRRFCRLSGSEANLAGYWTFDNGTAADLTGHGHNGTFGGNAQAIPLGGTDVVHNGLCGFPISIRVSQVELCWDTYVSNWYQAQYQSALTTNQWLPLMTNWVAGNGNEFCTNDIVPPGQAQRYYRVVSTNAPPN